MVSTFKPPALTLSDAQAREPYPGAPIGNSPLTAVGYDFRYDLAAWLE